MAVSQTHDKKGNPKQTLNAPFQDISETRSICSKECYLFPWQGFKLTQRPAPLHVSVVLPLKHEVCKIPLQKKHCGPLLTLNVLCVYHTQNDY